MKKGIFCFSLLLAAAVGAVAGGNEKDREELMARMGFSKEEIAKEVAAHNALAGNLDVTRGKSDSKAAASVLNEASEINKLRGFNIILQEADEAERRAERAKAKQREAEGKAEVVRRNIRRLSNVSTQTLADIRDVHDDLDQAAEDARAAAQEETQKANQARAAANAIIAAKAKLEKERAARAIAIRDGSPQR